MIVLFQKKNIHSHNYPPIQENIAYRQQFRLVERRWTVELLNEGGQVINLCFGIAISAIDAVVGGSMQQ